MQRQNNQEESLDRRYHDALERRSNQDKKKRYGRTAFALSGIAIGAAAVLSLVKWGDDISDFLEINRTSSEPGQEQYFDSEMLDELKGINENTKGIYGLLLDGFASNDGTAENNDLRGGTATSSGADSQDSPDYENLMNDMQSELSQLRTSREELYSRIDSLEREITVLREQDQYIGREGRDILDTIVSDIEQLYQNDSLFDQDISGFNQRVSGLENELSGLSERLAGLERHTASDEYEFQRHNIDVFYGPDADDDFKARYNLEGYDEGITVPELLETFDSWLGINGNELRFAELPNGGMVVLYGNDNLNERLTQLDLVKSDYNGNQLDEFGRVIIGSMVDDGRYLGNDVFFEPNNEGMIALDHKIEQYGATIIPGTMQFPWGTPDLVPFMYIGNKDDVRILRGNDGVSWVYDN
ncbi:MAG: hypothetical protein ACLFUO_05560 [Candidatus Woesearchaeota archaeon]